MIKIKDIISEITGKEAFNKYVPLKDEEISLMKQLLDDNGILIKIQQKTGKVKSHTEKNFFEFPNDLNEPSLKSQFDKIVNRVKEMSSWSGAALIGLGAMIMQYFINV